MTRIGVQINQYMKGGSRYYLKNSKVLELRFKEIKKMLDDANDIVLPNPQFNTELEVKKALKSSN